MTNSILTRLPKELLDSDVPKVVLVAGASGGIGHAFCEQLSIQFPNVRLIRLAREPQSLSTLPVETLDLAFDIASESSIDNVVSQLPSDVNIDWVFIATGWLHDKERRPEKTYRVLNAEQMAYSYQVNAVGPTLLVKALMTRVNRKHPLKIGILTARVGSISDNRLGGWHSYRASKAALNMFIKNFAIEFERMKRPIVIIGLQPGTTDTELSAPFQQGVSPENLQTPTYTAEQLLKVMQVAKATESGGLYDFLGEVFAP